MADWEEIKRLAADFQRTQTSDTLQKISERNCIDIVKKLTDLNLIELIYTCDGKEFLTPTHLLKEIEDEIYVNGGRMHLHDLAANLNVDYQHIENKAKDLARDKPDEYSLILGQLIHSTYKNTLGKQIADHMLINGELSIADFAKSLDLPSEFLLTIVKEMLPKVMDDYVVGQDGRTYYTTDMMDKYKSIIAGTLSAISKPTTVASLLKRLDIPERIFMPIIDGLIKDGRIDATIENRLYIPSVYAREQNEWINNFFNSNSYIGYDVLSRMDIKQPKAFLKKRFPDGIQLKTCLISPNLLSQVESLIEDTISSNGFIDITTIVPSSFEIEDIELLLQNVYKSNNQFSSSSLIFNKTNICSVGYIASSKSSFESMMASRAQEQLKQGVFINHFLGGKMKETPARKDQELAKKKLSDDNQVEGGNNESGKGFIEDDKNTKNNNSLKIQQAAIKDPNPNDGSKNTSNWSDEETQNWSRKNKKDKRGKTDTVENMEDSDEEQGTKKGKGSRKSGGGTQGREIKQKSVKKKYVPGNKGKKDVDNNSDDDSLPSKTPRSNKGRAARRNISPERIQASTSKQQSKTTGSTCQPIDTTNTPQKRSLVFMDTSEIMRKLKQDSKGLEESTDEFFESIAISIEEELNHKYNVLAKKIFDDFLRTQSEENEQFNDNDEERVDFVD